MTRYLFLLILLALALGCSPRPPVATQPEKANVEGGLRKMFPILDRTIALKQLNDIGMAFRLMAGEGRAPKTIEELEPYYENRKITQAIKDGAIVVILRVNPEKQPGEAILAYTQEPDANGERVVLLCDLSPAQAMGAQAFEAAPKAKVK
jgi:hypothetical protein